MSWGSVYGFLFGGSAGMAGYQPPPGPFTVCYTLGGVNPIANLLTDPSTTIYQTGQQFDIDSLGNIQIASGYYGSGTTTDDAELIYALSTATNAWTLEVTIEFDALPVNFLDIVNEHIFFGIQNDSDGPCAGLFISATQVGYAGGVHRVGGAGGYIVVDSAIQEIPPPPPNSGEPPGWNFTLGESYTFRIAVSKALGAAYIYITRTANLASTGHRLVAIVPVITGDQLFTPPSGDHAVVTVRGSINRPSLVTLGEFCIAYSMVAANIAPVASAGQDQAIRLCSIVELDGSGSYDPEGADLTYFWRLIDGPIESAFVVSEDDGFVVNGVGSFTNKFYSAYLATLVAVDPVAIGDVLTINDGSRTIIGTGTDGNGYYLLFADTDIPDTLGTNLSFRVLRQRGVNNPTTEKASFLPDKPGFYKFDLVVTDSFGVASTESIVVVNVLESPLPRGCTPDLNFMFNFLSDFWNLVEDKDVIPVFWSGLAQVAATELFTLWQHEYSKSLRDVQRQFTRRWLHYDLLLPEPLPQVTSIRAVWGGITSDTFTTIAAAGTHLDISSQVLGETAELEFIGTNPLTFADVKTQLINRLAEVHPDFSVYEITKLSGEKYLRIDAPFPFSIAASTTTVGLFAEGDKSTYISGTGGAYLNASTYRVSKSLSGLPIKENDLLVLDGIGYRIASLIDEPTDSWRHQRVVLKDELPGIAATSATWAIAGYVKSEFLNFYAGLVSDGDSVYFEVSDETGTTSSKFATYELVKTTALGACAAEIGVLAVDLYGVGHALVDDTLSVRLAKVVRRTYVPIDSLVQDVPHLSEKIVLETEDDEQRVLRRNLDFHIESYRGQNALRFESGIGADVWEGGDPPNRLWAEYTFLDNRPTVEANFGVPVEFTLDDLSELPSSVDYLAAVRGLWYAYFNGPTMYNLRVGIQILLGLPFAEETGKIEEINKDYSSTTARIIVRDNSKQSILRTYTYPKVIDLEINPATGEEYAVGDTVVQFAPLTKGVDAVDYVKDPTWFEGLLHQSTFFEVEKFFRFLIKIDGDAFNLSAVLFARDFILKIKPTYTYPSFVISRTVGDSDIDITSIVIYVCTLLLDDAVCSQFVLGSTIWDHYNSAGGGISNQYDADSDDTTAAPSIPTSDTTISWGYDKNYLCPSTQVVASCMTRFAAPTAIAFDQCFIFNDPISVDYAFRDLPVGDSFSINVAPALTLVPLDTNTPTNTVNITGTIGKAIIHTVVPDGTAVGGGIGAEATDCLLVILVNGVETASLPFVAQDNVYIELATTIAVVATDILTVGIRAATGGARTYTWDQVRVRLLQENAVTTWNFGDTLPAGTYYVDYTVAP